MSCLLLSLSASGCGSDPATRSDGEDVDGKQLEEVRVIRGDANSHDWGDLTILGERLDEHDGMIVTVRVGHPDRPPERLGSGQVRIAAGTFAISLPDVAETTLYKRRVAFIDADADGRCDASVDPVFSDSRTGGDLVLTLDPTLTSLVDLRLAESMRPDRDCEEAFNLEWPLE